jgi:hypothetical protein
MKPLQVLLFVAGIIVAIIVGLTAYVFLFTDSNTLDVDALDRPADQRILFIGNSYTDYNDLNEMAATLIEQAQPAWDDVLTGRHAPGGARFTDHIATVNDDDNDPALRQALVSGSDTLRDWDAVVLQEQSQILGFGAGNTERNASFTAAQQLHDIIRPSGAVTFLLMTWGRRDGDDTNANIYPNYRAMQQRLIEGYDSLALTLNQRNPGSRVYVIPAGLAYFLVYLDDEAAGRTPTASNAVFHGLYTDDGSHPSLEGSYLTAATIAAAYTGQPVADLRYVPDGISAEQARYLRTVADRVVFGDAFPGRRYVWQ